MAPSYTTHGQRAVEFDSTTHAARTADPTYFPEACAWDPAKHAVACNRDPRDMDVEVVEMNDRRPVTCADCVDLLEA